MPAVPVASHWSVPRNAQYTLPTQRNCRVESRRRGVGGVKWQLAHDDCRRVRSRRRHDSIHSTRQLRRLGGVYWAEWCSKDGSRHVC